MTNKRPIKDVEVKLTINGEGVQTIGLEEDGRVDLDKLNASRPTMDDIKKHNGTIDWNTTADEDITIARIVRRYEKLCQESNNRSPYTTRWGRIDLTMDLAACHKNGCPLNLEKLLSFDKFSFGHDIMGIKANMDRTTGKLLNCFLPRCSAVESDG